MANSFSTTLFTSRALGTFLKNHSNILRVAYRGVSEYETANGMGYAPGRGAQGIVNVKIPGYPVVQRGLATTPQDIQDRVVSYTLTDQDIYNVSYDVDIQEIGASVVGGEAAFTGNPYKSDKNDKEINPQAKHLIDDYITPAAEVIKADIEKEIMGKAQAASFYTPIDTIDKLGTVDSFSSISAVRRMMNNIGFQSTFRYAFMNENDYQDVSDSLQNRFDQTSNTIITKTGGYDAHSLAGFELTASNTIEDTAESPQYTANPASTGVQVSAISANGQTITLSGVIVTAGLVFNKGTLLSIPSVNLFNKVNKITLTEKLVVVVSEDANGNNDGTVDVVISEPLAATGFHANVNVLPAATDAVVVYPAHRNNYFFIPMGIIANPIKLGKIHGADNNRYVDKANNMDCISYIQGVVNNGVNSYRLSCQCPTLAVSSYLVNLPSVIQ